MSSQHQNKENPGGNAPSNASSNMEFSLASLATATLGPSHDSLAEWAANVSRRDNPISDFLFEFEFEKPIQKEPAQKKPTQKKSTQKKTAQKKTKTK